MNDIKKTAQEIVNESLLNVTPLERKLAGFVLELSGKLDKALTREKLITIMFSNGWRWEDSDREGFVVISNNKHRQYLQFETYTTRDLMDALIHASK